MKTFILGTPEASPENPLFAFTKGEIDTLWLALSNLLGSDLKTPLPPTHWRTAEIERIEHIREALKKYR